MTQHESAKLFKPFTCLFYAYAGPINISITSAIESLRPKRTSQKKFVAEMMARVDCIVFDYLGDEERTFVYSFIHIFKVFGELLHISSIISLFQPFPLL